MLNQIKVQVKPKDVSQNLLKNIQNKRVREVLEKRFGLKSGERQTLESIGREYNITRERVRQIEADGLRALAKPAVYGIAESVFKALEDHLNEHGGVAAEDHLLESVTDRKQYHHVNFLLTVGKPFLKKSETNHTKPSWFTAKESHDKVARIIDAVAKELEAGRTPVAKEVLLSMIEQHAERVLGKKPEAHMVRNILGLAKNIAENPFGEFGLVSWATIRPKGVRDKAYLVLQKAGKPMHFREIADAINKMKGVKKTTHFQTAHNELIKSSDRFVLVGRGLYALREWGYVPGTVADVMKNVLKEAGKPLGREEIVKKVLDKRFVKANTILLNLQNRNLFEKKDGKYFLV